MYVCVCILHVFLFVCVFSFPFPWVSVCKCDSRHMCIFMCFCVLGYLFVSELCVSVCVILVAFIRVPLCL